MEFCRKCWKAITVEPHECNPFDRTYNAMLSPSDSRRIKETTTVTDSGVRSIPVICALCETVYVMGEDHECKGYSVDERKNDKLSEEEIAHALEIAREYDIE